MRYNVYMRCDVRFEEREVWFGSFLSRNVLEEEQRVRRKEGWLKSLCRLRSCCQFMFAISAENTSFSSKQFSVHCSTTINTPVIC